MHMGYVDQTDLSAKSKSCSGPLYNRFYAASLHSRLSDLAPNCLFPIYCCAIVKYTIVYVRLPRRGTLSLIPGFAEVDKPLTDLGQLEGWHIIELVT